MIKEGENMKHDKNMQNKKQRNEENFNMKKTT
jgi:hypothetical protein